MAGFQPANGTRRGDGTELDIRRLLVKSHLVEAIVILPRNMLYSTDISVTLQISAGNQQNGKTVKLRNRKNIAELFGRDSKTIHKHIANAIKEELADEVVVANFATTTEHGAIKGKNQTNHARFAVLQALKRRPRNTYFNYTNSLLKQHHSEWLFPKWKQPLLSASSLPKKYPSVAYW